MKLVLLLNLKKTASRAAQERSTHAEQRLSELISQNAQLEQKLKEVKQRKPTARPSEELKEGIVLFYYNSYR